MNAKRFIFQKLIMKNLRNKYLRKNSVTFFRRVGKSEALPTTRSDRRALLFPPYADVKKLLLRYLSIKCSGEVQIFVAWLCFYD